MTATIFLILATAAQTANLVAVEPAGDVKYCVYERNDEVWELEVFVDEICPATVITTEEQVSE
jgi:hypothetical protein